MSEFLGTLAAFILFIAVLFLADKVTNFISFDGIVHRIKMRIFPAYRRYHEMSLEDQRLMRFIAEHLQEVNKGYW